MNPEKQIAAVGISDEETAHLRLLIRKAGDELSHKWRWGSETGADLVVVDPSSFAGQMARTRASAAGLRVAVFSDDAASADLVLQRPLKLANVVEVLNKAVSNIARPAEIVSQKQDFYFHDLAEGFDADLAPAVTDAPPRDAGQAAPGLDELLREDPAEVREALRVPVRLDENTTVFGTGGPTVRSEARGREGAELFAKPPPSAEMAVSGPRRGAPQPDTERHDLRTYLEGSVLGGPVQTMLAGAPPLALDPKNKTYHSSGGLASLEPYARTALRVCDWQPLTSAELADLRAAEPAQPYARLVWLYVLVHSNGQLARHLDPGGTYRLVRWIEIDRDFRSYFRIASAMLTPARLHEIAAASGAPMSDVFDAVNAYDAIGLIEWQPRAPRGGEPPPKPASSLLRKLRKPFGR